jgi:DNA mismatch repair ATPase MutL
LDLQRRNPKPYRQFRTTCARPSLNQHRRGHRLKRSVNLKRNCERQSNIRDQPSDAKVFPDLPPLDSAVKLVREVAVESVSSNIRPLGQLDESFIIATDDEGLLLIDQHVAHERILFDKYRALEASRRPESQHMLIP